MSDLDQADPTGPPASPQNDLGSPTGPTSPTVPPASPDDAPLASAPAGSSPGPNAASIAWSNLDATSRLVVAGSLAAIVITILGVPIGAWVATDFVLIMLVASIATAATAWAVRSYNQPTPIPLPIVELGAGAVAAVLAVWNLIEVVFDLDAPRGGIVGVILAVGLAIAAVAVLVGALRRGGEARDVLMPGDMWSRIALGGLVLVLIGWALNLSISYWTMSAATLTLAVLTLATVIIVASGRIATPIPAAWVGVVLGVFGAYLALELWGELADLGENRVDLAITDILPFLIYVVGILGILAGGVLTALQQQGLMKHATAGEPPPSAPA